MAKVDFDLGLDFGDNEGEGLKDIDFGEDKSEEAEEKEEKPERRIVSEPVRVEEQHATETRSTEWEGAFSYKFGDIELHFEAKGYDGARTSSNCP